MPEVIGIRYIDEGKTYYYSPNGETCAVGDYVIIKSEDATLVKQHDGNKDESLFIAKVVLANRDISENNLKLSAELKPIERKANAQDIKLKEQLDKESKTITEFAQKTADLLNLSIEVITGFKTFDKKKLMVYFYSKERVDFRELIKSLATQYHLRIELRQMQLKSDVQIIQSVGICGRECCCRVHLNEPLQASMKMAKTQGISLSDDKQLYGICGKIMCCMSYENDEYERLNNLIPKKDAKVLVNGKEAVVISRNIITEKIVIKYLETIDEQTQTEELVYTDVEIVKDKENKNSNFKNKKDKKDKKNH